MCFHCLRIIIVRVALVVIVVSVAIVVVVVIVVIFSSPAHLSHNLHLLMLHIKFGISHPSALQAPIGVLPP